MNRPTLSPIERAHRRDRLIDAACVAGALVIAIAIIGRIGLSILMQTP